MITYAESKHGPIWYGGGVVGSSYVSMGFGKMILGMGQVSIDYTVPITEDFPSSDA
jgi:hypothetical protein